MSDAMSECIKILHCLNTECHLKQFDLLNRTGVISATFDCVCMMADFYYPGINVLDLSLANPTDCLKLCQSTPDCSAFNYAPGSGNCYLKETPNYPAAPYTGMLCGLSVCPDCGHEGTTLSSNRFTQSNMTQSQFTDQRCLHKRDSQGFTNMRLTGSGPVQFFSVLQSYCSRLSVVLLSYVRLDRRKKFGRVMRQRSV